MNGKITPRESDMLEFIIKYQSDHGYAPTHKEIMKGINTKSYFQVVYMLDNLFDKGFLIYEKRVARSIIVNKEVVTNEEG